jgi:ankyrin repeat protein
MKKILRFLALTLIFSLSLLVAGDISRSSAQGNRYPEYQLLVHSLRGNTEAVRNLLRNGADPNSPPGPNDKGMNSLIFASWKGHQDIVRLLVDAGADLNFRSQTGATALVYAASGGHEECVRILLNKGARTDIPMNDGTTALLAGVRSKNSQIVEMIARQSSAESINLRRQNGDNALLFASKSNDLRTLDAVLGANPALEEKDGFGQTALMNLARKGNTRGVIHLLKKGANPNTRDNKGRTARTKARIGKHRAVQQVLKVNGGKG